VANAARHTFRLLARPGNGNAMLSLLDPFRLARTLAIASPELFITGTSVPQVERDEATVV